MTIAVEKGVKSYQEVGENMNLNVTEVQEDSINLLKDTYIDDGTTHGSKKQVERMIGIKLEDEIISETIPQMI